MVVGLTGGVGSGKSVAMSLLSREFGAKLLIADDIGHRALEPNTLAYERIRNRFGAEYFTEDGEVDRNRLAALVYADGKKRAVLNDIVHPYVLGEIRKKLAEWREEPLVAIETAILFETECDKLCDQVWWIDADREVRIRRLMVSRGYSRERAEAIMSAQLPEEEWLHRCHFRIENNGDEKNLCRQLKELLCTEQNM